MSDLVQEWKYAFDDMKADRDQRIERIRELGAQVAQMVKIIQLKDGLIMDYYERAEKAEAEVTRLAGVWEELGRVASQLSLKEAEVARLRGIEIAAQALADYCELSVNAGPITKGPHREAALWRDLRAALAKGGGDGG